MGTFGHEAVLLTDGDAQNRYRHQWESHDPLPFQDKQDAVAFLNSNCDAPSGRTRIVEALKAQPGIRVDALGLCLNGSGMTRGPEAKFNTFRRCFVSANGFRKNNFNCDCKILLFALTALDNHAAVQGMPVMNFVVNAYLKQFVSR